MATDVFYSHGPRSAHTAFQAGIYNEWLAENADDSHALCARANWIPRGEGRVSFAAMVMVDAPYGAEAITRARLEVRARLAHALDEARALTREHALMFQAFPTLSVRTMHALWNNGYHTIVAVVDLVRWRWWRHRPLRHLGPKGLRLVRHGVEQYLHQCPALRYTTTLNLEPVRVPCGCRRCKGQWDHYATYAEQLHVLYAPEHLGAFLATGTWPRSRGRSLAQIYEEERLWRRDLRTRRPRQDDEARA